MKKIICYLRTIKELDTFLMALFDYGAIYVAHDYQCIQELKLNKRTNRLESKLKCNTCGNVSISWMNVTNSELPF